MLLEYCDAATEFAENYQNRCLRPSTWQAVYDQFPACGVFYIPRPPLIEILEITYLDTAGEEQTLAESEYVVDVVSEPGRVALAYGNVWPITLNQIGAVTVTFQAGFEDMQNVEATTKQAVRVLTTNAYKFRESIVEGSLQEVPLSVTDMLDQNKLVSYR